MVNGVWISLPEPSESLVFFQDRPKRVARPYTRGPERRDLLKFLLG
jgi:hypothetical protein